MTQHTREELLYLAKLAEQCERYDGKYFSMVDSNWEYKFVVWRWEIWSVQSLLKTWGLTQLDRNW